MRFFVGRTTPRFCSLTVVFSLLLGLLDSAPAVAQSLAAPAALPTFQSVSVTPSQSTKQYARISTQEGTANFSGYSLQELIKDTYGINDPQRHSSVLGGLIGTATPQVDPLSLHGARECRPLPSSPRKGQMHQAQAPRDHRPLLRKACLQ